VKPGWLTKLVLVLLTDQARPHPPHSVSHSLTHDSLTHTQTGRPVVVRQMLPSRQERRKAGRDAAKRAPATSGAAGAAVGRCKLTL
jgi:hypothetical protein